MNADNRTVSLADIARWREESAALGRDIDDRQKRKAALDARIAKADELFRLLAGDGPTLDEEPQASPPEAGHAPPPLKPVRTESGRNYGRVTFVEAIRGAILQSPEGRLSPQMVREALAQTEMGDRLKESDKGFYHAISRLSERGEIIKHNGWLFTPAAYLSYMEDVNSGRIEDLPPEAQRPSPMALEIFRFLETNGPANGGRIVLHLLSRPEFKETLTKSNSGAYNVLSRLVKRTELAKDGPLYKLPGQPSAEKGELL